MRIGKKHVWLVSALVAVVGVAIIGWWTAKNRIPPVILTLPDGTQYRFAGITYGTKNTPPIFLARLADWLPTNLAKYVRSHAGTRLNQVNQSQIYSTPRYFVWFEKAGSNTGPVNFAQYFNATLSDENGAEGGTQEFANFYSLATWAELSFPVVPKRSRIIQLNFYSTVGGINAGGALAKVSFPNPFYGHYPQWRPESVPAVKRDGDLEVRLEDFAAMGTDGRAVALPPAAYADVSARSTRNTDEFWVVHAYALSDATGNVLSSHVLSSPPNVLGGVNSATPLTWFNEHIPLNARLWPGEAAWRLKLELKRKAGFRPEDLTTFSKLPVPSLGATNTAPITNMVGGVKVVLTEFRQVPAGQALGVNSRTTVQEIKVELPDPLKGVMVDLVKLTTDDGDQITTMGLGWNPDQQTFSSVQLIPSNTKTVDLTLAVQKTRSVGFLVKPPN